MAQKFDIDFVKKDFIQNGCELLEDKYINNRMKMKYKCSCGEVSEIRYEHFRRGVRCKKCGYKKNSQLYSLSFEEVKRRFELKGRKVLQDYYLSHQPVLNICTCGNVTKTFVYNLPNLKGCLKCAILKGEAHPMWSGKYTSIDKKNSRKFPEYYRWKKMVHERDNYKCVICKKSHKLHSHHIQNYSENEEKQLCLDNGITLCIDCHVEFHNKYGYTNNNKVQVEDFIKNKLGEL